MRWAEQHGFTHKDGVEAVQQAVGGEDTKRQRFKMQKTLQGIKWEQTVTILQLAIQQAHALDKVSRSVLHCPSAHAGAGLQTPRGEPLECDWKALLP